jgi:hypothetical protein
MRRVALGLVLVFLVGVSGAIASTRPDSVDGTGKPRCPNGQSRCTLGSGFGGVVQEQGDNPDMGDREGVPPSAGSGSR